MLKHSLFTLEHVGLDSSHLSCLDCKSQLLYTDTGKKQALEGNSAPQNADGISLGYGTEDEIWEFFRTGRLFSRQQFTWQNCPKARDPKLY